MKPIAQTRNFSVCLHGVTLPINCLYGNIYGITFTCVNFAPVRRDGRDCYAIRIYDQAKNAWVNTDTRQFGAIYVRIRDFMRSPDFRNEPVIRCEHWTKRAERAERDHARVMRREERERARQYREDMADAPRMKKAQDEYIFRCRPQHGDNRYEYTSGLDIEGYNGIDAISAVSRGYRQGFEAGQNTAGTASSDCPYTRSAWETREHMKVCRFDKTRPKVEKPTVTNPYKVCKDDVTGTHYVTKHGVRID